MKEQKNYRLLSFCRVVVVSTMVVIIAVLALFEQTLKEEIIYVFAELILYCLFHFLSQPLKEMRKKRENFKFYFHRLDPLLKSEEMEEEVSKDLLIAKKSAVEINETTAFSKMKNIAKYWGFWFDLCEPGLTDRIVKAVHEIDSDFWIPSAGASIGNGQIAYFVDFFLTYHLDKRVKKGENESFANFSNRICAEVRSLSPDFWVPAVDNAQLGVFVDFCHRHDLWEKFQDTRLIQIK